MNFLENFIIQILEKPMNKKQVDAHEIIFNNEKYAYYKNDTNGKISDKVSDKISDEVSDKAGKFGSWLFQKKV